MGRSGKSNIIKKRTIIRAYKSWRKRYGRLFVIRIIIRGQKGSLAVCICDCGNKITIPLNYIRVGDTRSCGCLWREAITKHEGILKGIKVPEYGTWDSMIQRCHNPKNPNYIVYGALGISVCNRWRGKNGFIHFYKDMGAKPNPKFSLDRIDTYGSYSKQNCQWASKKQQSANRRPILNRTDALVILKLFREINSYRLLTDSELAIGKHLLFKWKFKKTYFKG